jgi:hypothetical protein
VIANRFVYRLVLLAALATACTSSGQKGNAFVTLTVELFVPSGNTGIGLVNSAIDDTASTIACARFRNNLKNPTVTSTTPLDNISVTSYTINLTRSDGQASPMPFRINSSFTVPAGHSTSSTDPTVTGNTLVVAVLVVPSDLKSQLQPRPRLPLVATSDIVFKGQDQRGQTVQAETAITVQFVGGDEAAASCPATF